MSDENKIYDIDNYEDLSKVEEKEDTYIEKENNINDFDSEEKEREEQESINDVNLEDNNNRKKKKNGLKNIALILVVGLLGGIVGGGATYYAVKNINGNTGNVTSTPNPPTFNTDGESVLTKTQAFEKVAPAVVIVSTKGTTNYGGFIPQKVEGIGSGFIINEEGYILTNYHVIEGAQEVTVTLSDKREVKAKVVNYDKNQDVAMIKIVDNIKVPAVVQLGDSDALKPGEEVLAIGTPLSKEFSQTVTGGLVSAINRNVETKNGVKLNLIQTDTAINPGNSGGPLINTKGEVIGINTMKISGEAEGIGFSIPINEVKDRIDSLSKPILNLGVSIREVNSDLSKQYDMPEGLYVVEVMQFSPAEKAGIKGGDVITKFDGQRIKNFDELKKIRDSKSEGDIVKVEVVRNKESINVDLQLTAQQ